MGGVVVATHVVEQSLVAKGTVEIARIVFSIRAAQGPVSDGYISVGKGGSGVVGKLHGIGADGHRPIARAVTCQGFGAHRHVVGASSVALQGPVAKSGVANARAGRWQTAVAKRGVEARRGVGDAAGPEGIHPKLEGGVVGGTHKAAAFGGARIANQLPTVFDSAQRGPGRAIVEIEASRAIRLKHQQARGGRGNGVALGQRHAGYEHPFFGGLHIEDSRGIGVGIVSIDAHTLRIQCRSPSTGQ